jgi:hypothetical protein
MGQVPDDLNAIPAVAAEVDALRDRTEQIVAELERRLRARATQVRGAIDRFKRVTDVRGQIAAHPRITIGVSSVAAIALGLGVYFAIARRRQARKPMSRLMARARAYKALLADPGSAMHRREPIGGRVLAAVLVAGATTLVRGLGLLFLARTLGPRLLPPHRPREV